MTEQPPDIDMVHVDLPSYFFDHYAPYSIVYVEWTLDDDGNIMAFIHRKIADTYLGHFMVPPPRYNVMAMVDGGDLIGVDVHGNGVFQIAGFEPNGQDAEDFFNQQIE